MDALETTGPLAGVRVVEFAGLAPVTVAGMVLSDLGADVVRVDRLHHAADTDANDLRRGRRSICLDLKHGDGLAVATRLIERSDLLIEAYRPGVMERLGLGPDVAHDLNPGLIYGRLTGWGQTGPFAHAAGHDITYLALTGALYPIGPADRPPTPPLNYVADMGGGAMFLLLGLLAALHERQTSGIGQVVDAAMVDGVTILAGSLLRARADGNWRAARGANVLDGGAPFYGSYECRDGGFIAVGAIEPEFYATFVVGLGFQLDELPAQHDHEQWPDTRKRFAERIAQRSRAEWEQTFEGSDACVAAILTLDEAPDHPQIAHRAAYTKVDGRLQASPAPKFARTPGAIRGPSPRRGAHTRELLAELGWDDAAREALIRAGAAHDDREA